MIGRGRGVGREKETEVETKVEATRCRDIAGGCEAAGMVATRARWRVGSCLVSNSGVSCNSGWGRDGEVGTGEKPREVWEGAGDMGYDDGASAIDVGAGTGIGAGGVGGMRGTPWEDKALRTASQPRSKVFMRSLSSSFSRSRSCCRRRSSST